MEASEMTNEELAKELTSRVPLDSNRHDDIREAVREVAKEMLNTSIQDIRAEAVYGWATRLAEAYEQPVTDCNQLNNAAKMREALVQCELFLGNVSRHGHPTLNPGDKCTACDGVDGLREMVASALSAPSRNCDVGTAEEQSERYEKFCYAHRSREKGCGDCPLLDGGPCCELAWTQMPYETVKQTKENKK